MTCARAIKYGLQTLGDVSVRSFEDDGQRNVAVSTVYHTNSLKEKELVDGIFPLLLRTKALNGYLPGYQVESSICQA